MPPALQWWVDAAPRLVCVRVGWDEGHTSEGAEGWVEEGAWEGAWVLRMLELRQRVGEEVEAWAARRSGGGVAAGGGGGDGSAARAA